MMCTTASPSSAWPRGPPRSPPPTPRTRNASLSASPDHRRAPRKSGSILPRPAPPESHLTAGLDPRYAEGITISSRRGGHDSFTARSHGHPGCRPPRRTARCARATSGEGLSHRDSGDDTSGTERRQSRRLAQGAAGPRLRRRAKPGHRISVGGWSRRAVPGPRGRTGSSQGRPDRDQGDASRQGGQESDRNNTNGYGDDGRPACPRGELRAPGWQYHGGDDLQHRVDGETDSNAQRADSESLASCVASQYGQSGCPTRMGRDKNRGALPRSSG